MRTAAKSINFVNLLNLRFAFKFSLLYNPMTSENILYLRRVVPGAHKFGSIPQGFVFCAR